MQASVEFLKGSSASGLGPASAFDAAVHAIQTTHDTANRDHQESDEAVEGSQKTGKGGAQMVTGNAREGEEWVAE